MRHTSFISLLAIVYLLLIVIYYYFFPIQTKDLQTRQLNKNNLSEINTPFPNNPKIEKFIFSMNIFKNLPIFVFAFTCHQNVTIIYIFI